MVGNKINLRFIVKVDKLNRINFINNEYAGWLGYQPEELLKKSTSLFLVDETPEVVQKNIDEEVSQGRAVSLAVKEKKKNGETFWVDIRIQPVMEGGEYQGYTSIKRLILQEDRIAKLEKAYQDIEKGKKTLIKSDVVNCHSHRFNKWLRLNKLNIVQKVLAAVVFTAVVLLSLAYIYENEQKDFIFNDVIGDQSGNIQDMVDTYFNNKLDIGEAALAGIAKMPGFADAFAQKDMSRLDAMLGGLDAYFAKNSNNKGVKLQLVDNNGMSFYRSWVKKHKQFDVSWRQDVAYQNKSPKLHRTYSIGKMALTLKNHIPIYDANEQYLGSAILIQGLGSIHKALLPKNIVFITAVKKSYLTKRNQEVAKFPAVFNDDKLVLSSKKHYETERGRELVKDLHAMSSQTLLEKGYVLDDKYLHIALPLKDEQQKVMGYIIASQTINKFIKTLNSRYQAAEDTTTAILITFIIVTILLMIILQYVVIRPLRKAERTMQTAVKNSDLFARLSNYGEDEIAKLGYAYNQQAMLSQVAISEINTAMEEIVAGRLNHQVTFPFESDYGLLKDRMNETSQSLKDTFRAIADVMNDLKTGHFDAQSEASLQGAYAEVVEDCLSAMHDLNVIFSDISRVMELAAKGKFDELIQVAAEGDVKRLIETLNSTLKQLDAGFGDVISAAQRLAKGDLTQPIETDYEYKIGEAKQAINESMSGLGVALSKILEITNQLSLDVSTVNEGTQSLNSRTQEQAASLEETSSAMEQTAAQTRSNLDHTQEVNRITENQSGLLTDANKVMVDTQHSMGSIEQASNQIKEITTLIDSIAFQTNLLALNAAVEAARAGDHGRGFAVVAGEVRNLAGKSADAAKQIGKLVENTSEAIAVGANQVEEVAQSLNNITNETLKVRELVENVTRASKEQSYGIDEINKAITTIDGVTQQNAALVEETTATTESMNRSAEELMHAVNTFKIK